MKKFSKVICIILLSVMLLPTLVINAYEVSYSCGYDLTWDITSKGVLTISGTGEMYYYDGFTSFAPWHDIASAVTSVQIKEGVTSISNFAFSDCINLKSVTIPSSIEKIGGSAFSNCPNITDVNIADLTAWCNIDFGDAYANPLNYTVGNTGVNFNLNGSLIKNLVIPQGVEEVKYYSFIGCSCIESVVIPNSVTLISEGAFYSCPNLSSVSIPNSVTKIGEYAFYKCEALKTIDIPESVETIERYAFRRCYSLETVKIPAKVTDIKMGAFSECTNLKSVAFHENVKTIGIDAFGLCTSLEEITLPKSITSVGQIAFDECDSLKKIIFESATTEIYDSADTIPENTVIYGYKGSTAQAYAEKYNRKFVLIGNESHECAFGPWQVLGGQHHIRYCTDPDCDKLEEELHVYSGKTDIDCNVCGHGATKLNADFNNDGTVNNADAIYLLYHVIFGDVLYPLN